MNQHSHPMISTPDGDFRVTSAGKGKPILLVHGFPLDSSMWLHQMEPLAANHHVIAVDLLGFGGSTGRERSISTMAQFADELAGVLEAMGISEQIVFCGLSMGGYIGWEFWQRHRDRVCAMLMCDTRAAGDDPTTQRGRELAASEVLASGPSKLIGGMLPKLFAQSANPDAIAATEASMRRASPWAVAAALHGMAARSDFRERLGKIEIPTLLVCGDQDAITPPEEMRSVAAEIASSKFVEIADAGHMAPLEQPIPVNTAVLEFLQGLTS